MSWYTYKKIIATILIILAKIVALQAADLLGTLL